MFRSTPTYFLGPIASVSTALLLIAALPGPVAAQAVSFAPGSATVPPPPPPGPCSGAYSAEGDIVDLSSGLTLPMGPSGCGLAWPGTPPPSGSANVNAFSSAFVPVSFPFAPPGDPIPPGSFSLDFSVDPSATGDASSTCTIGLAGPTDPDVTTEACDQPTSTDAPADINTAASNPSALPSAPAPGSMPHFQAIDGDGATSAGCQVPPRGSNGLVEPMPGGDDIDAHDITPISVYDFDTDGVPDTAVYYSVDPATAASSLGFAAAADVITAVGGGAAIYASATTLGLSPTGDDIDALVVLDTFFDTTYTPTPGIGGEDRIYYSLAPGSTTIGTTDTCLGIAISEADVLTDGAHYGFSAGPCIIIPEENIGLWSFRSCGINTATGLSASDNVNAIAFGPPVAGPDCTLESPPDCAGFCSPGQGCFDLGGSCGCLNTTTTTTTTSTTTTSTTTTTTSTTTTTLPPPTTTTTTSVPAPTTTTTTTTLLPPLCGPAPLTGCTLGVAPGRQRLEIKSKNRFKDRFRWKFIKGDTTFAADFLNPVETVPPVDYVTCVYDSSAESQPIMEMQLPAAGICGTRACWKSTSVVGFLYRDRAGTPHGITRAKLKEGKSGRSRIVVFGKGTRLPTPTLPLTTDVTVQFVVDDGTTTNCWQTTFATAARNKPEEFSAWGP